LNVETRVDKEVQPNCFIPEILAKAEWLTVDPYMRARSVDGMKIGDQFMGTQVAKSVIPRLQLIHIHPSCLCHA